MDYSAPVDGALLRYFVRAHRPHRERRCWRRRRLLVAAGLAVVVATGPAASESTAKKRPGPAVGIACTTWANRDVRYSKRLGNRLCRVEFEISTRAKAMEGVVAAYARAGIRVQPLAGFEGKMPTESEARRLRTWAVRFGPGGTFWQGRKSRMPILQIEFGNETSYSYQYDHNGTWSSSAELAARAREYALRAKSAATALRGTGVGLLLQGEDGDAMSTVWVDQMFAAVPELAKYVSGWTIHPYGESGFAKIDRMIAQLDAHRAPRSTPIYITEWGLASVDGHPLSNNYGYPTDMTYAEAAVTLRSVMERWNAGHGSRIAEVVYYMLTDLERPGTTSDGEQYFGALKVDGSSKGQYTLEVRAQIEASAPAIARQPTGSLEEAGSRP